MRSFIPFLLNGAAAFALSSLLVGIFLPLHNCHPWWANVWAQLHRLKWDVEWAESRESPLSRLDVEAWLSGKASAELAARMERVPPKDPWGQPYRCVEVQGAEGADRFGFYSTGRDGVSASGGDDPDDINSWSERRARYYQRETTAGALLVWIGLSAAATPVVYHFAGMLCSLVAAIFRPIADDSAKSAS